MKQIFLFLWMVIIYLAFANEPVFPGTGPILLKKGDSIKSNSFLNDKPFTTINPPPVKNTLRINNYIRNIFQDKVGNLWFGTYGEGICRYNGKTLDYFTIKNSFAGNVVRDIAEDEYGNIWFATNGGVYKYDGNSFLNYTVKDGLNSNEVWCILIDKNAVIGKIRIWFGTDAGVCRYDGVHSSATSLMGISGGFSAFPLPESNLKKIPEAYPSAKLVNCIFQDVTGNIWFGTNGNGVFCYNTNTDIGLYNISEKDGLCNNFVQGIFEDKSGNLWFSTRFGGVSCYIRKNYPTDRFTTYNKKNGLSSNFIWEVFEDKSGDIWFATAGGGVCVFNGKSIVNYSEKDGLANNYVQSIVLDNKGNLWFGTGLGLSRYIPKSRQGKDGKAFTNYKSEDGC